MNVLVVSSLYKRPGEQTGDVVHRQCVEVAKAGLRVQVICPTPRLRRGLGVRGTISNWMQQPSVEEVDGISVLYAPYFNIPHAISARWDGRRLEKVLRRMVKRLNFSPDLVHAHRLFPTAYASYGIARMSETPLIATVHGSDIHTNPHCNVGIQMCTAEILEKADRVLTVSGSLASDVSAFSPDCSPQVAYLGVDSGEFSPPRNQAETRRKLNLPENGVGVCSISRLTTEKNVSNLIDSFETVLKYAKQECWLVLVGDGPDRETVRDQIKKRGLETNIYLVGAQSHSEVPDWLRAADIFVLASKSEGLPNSVLEAMSSGLPVVAYSVGGIPEAVTPDCGYLLPTNDTQGFQGALHTLISSKQRRNELGRNARARAVEFFSWSTSARRVMKAYDRVVDGRRLTQVER